tara:strand:+ start:2398 stop:2598 length:201 start_codon:yes stop_codon:yes gene_type:complete
MSIKQSNAELLNHIIDDLKSQKEIIETITRDISHIKNDVFIIKNLIEVKKEIEKQKEPESIGWRIF